MNLTREIALRFLMSRKGPGRFTGIVSMAGMGVGCFALVISLAVLNGFEGQVHEKLRGFDGDLRVTGTELDATIQLLENRPEIQSVMPFKTRQGLVQYKSNQRMATFKAVDMQMMQSFYNVSIQGEIPQKNGILIGWDTAARLGVRVGDEMIISSPLDQTPSIGFPHRIKTIVNGIFHSQILDYDDRIIFLPAETGELLFKRVDRWDGIDLRIYPETNLEDAETSIAAVLPKGVILQTWEDIHSILVKAMRLERLGAISVLSLIILVAAFNLTATLSLITVQKIKEIGILRAMGTPIHTLKNVLVIQGFWRGGWGALSGLLSGCCLVFIQNITGFIPLPTDIYFMRTLPMELLPADILLITIIASGFILVSSWGASRKVAIIEPRDALQWAK